MRRLPLLIMPPPVIDLTGPMVRAAGWYGPTAGLHTIAIQTLNYTGGVTIEGSLSLIPTEFDWFTIPLGSLPVLNFPRPGHFPTYGPSWGGESVTLAFNVITNCLFMRARMIRTTIIPPLSTEIQISLFGSIDSIVVQY